MKLAPIDGNATVALYGEDNPSKTCYLGWLGSMDIHQHGPSPLSNSLLQGECLHPSAAALPSVCPSIHLLPAECESAGLERCQVEGVQTEGLEEALP